MKGFKDVIILLLISVFVGLSLSVVYTATKDRIAEVKQQELQSALKKVVPFLKDEYKEETIPDEKSDKDPYTLYAVNENGQFRGAAIKMHTNEGYSGRIEFLMGVDHEGKIIGFCMLDQKETPGLGTKAASEGFWGQFIGKSLDNFKFKVKKDAGDVDAITAATITSRAVTHAMEKGLAIFKQYRGAL